MADEIVREKIYGLLLYKSQRQNFFWDQSINFDLFFHIDYRRHLTIRQVRKGSKWCCRSQRLSHSDLSVHSSYQTHRFFSHLLCVFAVVDRQLKHWNDLQSKRVHCAVIADFLSCVVAAVASPLNFEKNKAKKMLVWSDMGHGRTLHASRVYTLHTPKKQIHPVQRHIDNSAFGNKTIDSSSRRVTNHWEWFIYITTSVNRLYI